MSASALLKSHLPSLLQAIGEACTYTNSLSVGADITVLREESPEALNPDGRKPGQAKTLKLVTVDRTDADSLAHGETFAFSDETLEVERIYAKDAYTVTALCSVVAGD